MLLGTVGFACGGCVSRSAEHNWSEVNRALELDTRLAAADFSLVDSDPDAVAVSWENLDQGAGLPQRWPVEFAGSALDLPPADAAGAYGITHESGRTTVVYPFGGVGSPAYGEIAPLAVAHYVIGEPELEIVLLLVCFQSDQEGAPVGVGVRSLDGEGRNTSSPFALALRPEDLAGRPIYDEALAGSKEHAVAARAGWDQGFLLISRLAPDVVLSTYLPWY